MEFLSQFLPRRARLWLISAPAALLSFERRQGLPQLPLGRWRWLGLPLLAAGVALWAWGAQTLAAHGQSTDPEEPPQVLVQEGPYRYTRNPMILAAVLSLSGLAILMRSVLLLVYALGFVIAVHRYLVRGEEAQLRERFGADYEKYAQRVPRWLPRFVGGDRRRAAAPAAEEV